MSILDVTLYVSIAILYNLFVHSLASISYKDLQYNDKHQNTIIMLILFGAIGILISKIIEKNNKKKKQGYVSKGLFYGGILLILTALFANWDSIIGELRLFMLAGALVILIWYGHNREKKQLQKEEDDEKINEEILTDLVKN